MINQKDCTIIIPHLGRTKEQCSSLHLCLESLRESVPDMPKVIVKNGDVPCTCHRDIRVVSQGQCKAVNAAIATTNTPWVFVTNDDMIYAPGWWEKLTESLASEAITGTISACISPMLVEPNAGAPTFEVQKFGGAGGDFDKEKWIEFARHYMLDKTYMDQSLKGIRTGFNLPFLIKRELWNLIGGYDINYDPWGSNSDSDLEYKIRLAGVQPYQNTNCVVYHFSTTSGTSHPDNRPYWEKNWHYFIEKWGFERASSPEIWTADFVIPKPPVRRFNPWWEGFYNEKTV